VNESDLRTESQIFRAIESIRPEEVQNHVASVLAQNETIVQREDDMSHRNVGAYEVGVWT
jgi:hypothetical protein